MSRQRTTLRHVATATIWWGVIFSIVHAYWALGGGDGLNDDGPASLAASIYVGFITVLGIIGTAVAFSLARPNGSLESIISQRRAQLLARIGGGALLAGVVVGVGRWIASGSLGDDGVPGVIITAYFLVGGILYSILGWGTRLPAAQGSQHTARSHTPLTERN